MWVKCGEKGKTVTRKLEKGMVSGETFTAKKKKAERRRG